MRFSGKLYAKKETNVWMVEKIQTISRYLGFPNKKFVEHFIPRKDLSILTSLQWIKGQISFINPSPL